MGFYGRLGVSWTGNGSSTNRLSDWLDPNGTSPTYIESYPPFETFAIDGGITSVDSPETGNLSDNENITITLRNFGENDISNFDIYFQINGGDIVTENYSGTISSSQSVQYTSNASFDLSAEGDYEIEVSISINNDENSDNDSLTEIVTAVGGDCPDYSLPTVWRDKML